MMIFCRLYIGKSMQKWSLMSLILLVQKLSSAAACLVAQLSSFGLSTCVS